MRGAVALIGVLLLSCGPAAAPSATPAPTAVAQSSQTPAATAPPSTSTPPPASSPTSAPNAARAEVLLRFAPGTNIADVDDITDIVAHLKSSPGIHDGFGDEGQITIVYDPRLITVERIRTLLEEMSYKTLPPT